ncbi:hypothetical protein [Muricomes intestini]|uniref:hypothetical protein n=1 Tax=Muricomes intestini TaxID=1796634 RepID=UPI002FE2EB0B
MVTERYTIKFFDLDCERYTADLIAALWDVSAEKIYEENNIYVSGDIYIGYSARQVNEKETPISIAFSIVSTRSPVEVQSEVDFWNAYQLVTQGIRSRLGNPCMSLSKQEVDFFYFQKL